MRSVLVTTALLVLCTLAKAEDFWASVLSGDKMISGILSNSVILTLPPCKFTGQQVNLEWFDNNGTSGNLTNAFMVPGCQFKRALIQASDSNPQFTVTRDLGYQLTRLTPGHTYNLQYVIPATQDRSNVVVASTRQVQDYNSINGGLAARSGGMIVITILLSIAMCVLIVGLIVAAVLGRRK
ncbi:uroplakin-2-like isoform X2 [Acipenser oxyrinchus oxyrinchus]|uniref:Uroplakin-2-like isoform X2 n=1 Tax=Acipenser oxyrinchus oxyrinchus TaxID=40147 RepID=A0AAD8CSF6_ACIOX|nr:uroplakin-2-like isoform X2 [Acipenser oxyrinchus oxyrinchus]KAK1155996.1 uroplakin-2-like isoform X2 [Acipenser oxyrinchus oxyrinchus]